MIKTMITAEEARKQTDIAKSLIKCEKNIEHIIKQAAQKGQLEVTIPCNLMPNHGIEALKKIGYVINEVNDKFYDNAFDGHRTYELTGYKIIWK